MTEAIMVALIAAGASVFCQVIISHSANKKAKEASDLTIYRIDQLEEKVNKHNNLIERVYKIEAQIEELQKD